MPESSTNTAHLAIPGIELGDAIARGGFATVYRGFQSDFNRTVAVKVLDGTPDESATRRFRSEIRAMGAVSDHPNVVPVYAAGTVDGRAYLVMPLLTGGTLGDEISKGPLPPAAVVDLGGAMADALAAAHAVGLLHRDVKPANILRTAYGHPQLADFGIARFVDSTMTHGDLLATVQYAAPEVLGGDPATAASDVYSLGATLHAAVTGHPPFAARAVEEPVALAVRVMTQPPSDLRAAGVPTALAEVIDKAMAKKVEDRYPTAEALRDALARIDLGAGLATTTPLPPPPTAPVTTVSPVVAAPAPAAPSPVAPSTPAAAPLVEPAPPRRTAPRPSRHSSRQALVGAVAVAVLLVAGLLLVLANRSTGTSSSTASKPPVTSAPVGAGAPAVSADAETKTTKDYYALLDQGHADEGFGWLSPAYQSRSGGQASYAAFWRTIAHVEVLAVEPGSSRASVTLRYTKTDGTVSTERATLRFVSDPATSDHLLIDDYALQ